MSTEVSTELSTDINIITAEINAYQRVAGEAIFEIGRRLKHVKENDLAHGEWSKWLSDINVHERQAQRMIRIFDRFSKATPVSELPKSFSVLYELTSFTDEELEQTYELPSGESKKPTEMSRREIETLKAEIKKEREAKEQAERQADIERSQRERLEEENEQLARKADKPPEIRTEYIEVDNTPHDYETTKQRLEEYRAKFGDLENYDEHITATHRQDMIVAVMSFSQGVREFIKRYDYMTKYKSVIDNLDEESKQQYDEAVEALKEMAGTFDFTLKGNIVFDAEYNEIN